MRLAHSVLLTALGVAVSGISVSSTYDGKYLIASFPDLRSVAYTSLPDTVWRPLVTGTLSSPGGVATDTQRHRLYVADAPNGKIHWYNLEVRNSDGFLFTDAVQRVAVDGFEATYLAVDGEGNLYFVGKTPTGTSNSVWRMDIANIQAGYTTGPVQVYSNSNTGTPAACYMPGGLGVDSFYIYWANEQNGLQRGSVNKGIRQSSEEESTSSFNMISDQDEVSGVVVTGTSVFYLSPVGVHGMPKTTSASTEFGENNGLMASAPSGEWDPKTITWDNDGTGYIADNGGGTVFTIPVTDTNSHNISHFVEAPGIWGLAMLDFVQGPSASTYMQVDAVAVQSFGSRAACSCIAFAVVSLAWLAHSTGPVLSDMR